MKLFILKNEYGELSKMWFQLGMLFSILFNDERCQNEFILCLSFMSIQMDNGRALKTKNQLNLTHWTIRLACFRIYFDHLKLFQIEIIFLPHELGHVICFRPYFPLGESPHASKILIFFIFREKIIRSNGIGQN